MKKPEEAWEQHPPFEARPPRHEHHPPFEEEAVEEDTPEFSAIRTIELLGRLHHMAFRTLFLQDGLPPAQAGAMRTVIRFPGLSQRELADKLHIQRATATVMLQKMEKAGYVERRPDQEDQRIFRIYPTALATAVDVENRKNVVAYFSRCFSDVPPEEFAVMVKCLKQLGKNLKGILDENAETLGKE